MNKTATVFAVVLALVLLVPVVALAEDTGPMRDLIAVGPSFSNLKDLGNDYGVRVQLLHGPLLLQGGWDNVDATVTTVTGLPMTVKGSMWSLDLSYVLWSMNPNREDKPGRPDLYYGLGIGAHNVDATWTLLADPLHGQDAKAIEPSAHAVVGARWPHFFIDARYVWCNNFFGFTANGVQGAIGGQWELGGK